MTPLPYEQPGQLVRFHQLEPGKPDTRDVLAGTHFAFLREHASSFEDVAALAHYSETGLDLVTDGRAERLRVLRVSSGYFSTLRAQPRLGRGFDRDDETGVRRVVLSDAVWRAHFAGDPDIIGRVVRLSAEPYEVAGIAPPGFEDPIAPDVAAWIPYALAGDTYEENNSLTAIGRLRNGISLERAQAELATLTTPMRERWPAASEERDHRRAAAGRARRRRARPAASGVCRGSPRPADRVRQRRQPHSRACHRSRSRVRRPRRPRLEPSAAGQAVARGERPAGDARRNYRSCSCHEQRSRDAAARAPRPATPGRIGLDAGVLLFAILATAVSVLFFGVAPALQLSGIHPAEAFRQQSRSDDGRTRTGAGAWHAGRRTSGPRPGPGRRRGRAAGQLLPAAAGRRRCRRRKA